MLPQLRKLEHAFSDRLVMIGVHSGKFIAERNTENIRLATLRLGVHHPVVNDRQFRVWRAYAVNAWPTITLIDAEGYVVAQQAGEIAGEALIPVVERLIAEAPAAPPARLPSATHTPHAELAALPSAALPISDGASARLRFPEKLAFDPATGRLHIADTGHHRILSVRLDAEGRAGEIERVIGGDASGLRDGPADLARFQHPQGVAAGADGRIFVADTFNHAIRAIAADGTVTTIAGTGEQARRWRAPDAAGNGQDVATATPLNSPWDVRAEGDTLYVAMAGSHQLWRMDLTGGVIVPWSGSGAEALEDGPPHAAALAQPSGLALHQHRLYFADSESSAIRYASTEDGSVTTLVGTGLFDFGDRDGAGDGVRLQHPLALAVHEGVLYIADTYNHKIKRLDPARREVTTWIGEAANLHEPGGLSFGADGLLYIADTNHHRILSADLRTSVTRELDLMWG